MNPTPAQLPEPYEALRRAVWNDDRATVLAATRDARRNHDMATLRFLATECAARKATLATARNAPPAPAAPGPHPRAIAAPVKIAGHSTARPPRAAPESITAPSEADGRESCAEPAATGLRQFFGRVLPCVGPYGLSVNDLARKAAGAPDAWREFHGIPTLDELARQAMQLAPAPLDMYFWTASGSGTRSAANAERVRALRLDLDAKDFGGSKTALRRQLEGFCRAVGIPRPPILVDSGGGYHCYWSLTRDLAAAEWKVLAELLKALCTPYDFPADPSVTADLARVLRVPSTPNYKYNPPRSVRVRYDTRESFDPDGMRAILQRALENAPARAPLPTTSGLSINDDLSAGLYEQPNRADVESMLPYFGDGGDRERWITVLQGLHDWDRGGEDGFELADQWSATQPKYHGTADVRKTWDSFGSYSGQRVTVKTLFKIAVANGWRKAVLAVPSDNYLTNALRSAPATPTQRFATDEASRAYLIARYVWIRCLGKYLDRLNGALSTGAEIDTAETRWMTGGSPRPSVLLRQAQCALIADALGYKFGAPALYKERVGDHELTFANMAVPYYVEPLSPTNEESSLLETYFAHLFKGRDGEIARRFVLDAFAYLVQNPRERWRFGILFAGLPGCGKGVLFQQMTALLFGAGNVGETNIEEVARGFSGSLTGKLIRVADEVRQSFVRDGEKLFNTWKPYITNAIVSVQRKGQDSFDVHNSTNHVGLTNYPLDAGYFQDNDRRWFVFASEAPRMDVLPWTDAFFEFLRSDRAAGFLKHFFMQRDVSAFNPFRSPPMTSAKRQMIESSMDDVTAEVLEMFHARAAPFHRDLFTLVELRTEVGARVRRFEGVGLKKLSAIIKAEPISAEPLPYKRRIGPPRQTGNPCNLWAWRNAGDWSAATNEEIFNHRLKGNPPIKALTEADTDQGQTTGEGAA